MLRESRNVLQRELQHGHCVVCIDFVKLTWSARSSHELETRVNRVRVLSEISDRACYTSARESADFLKLLFFLRTRSISVTSLQNDSSVIVNGIVSDLANICRYFRIVSFNV